MDEMIKQNCIALFFIFLSLSGCTAESPESHIIFYDEEYEKVFKQELDIRGVAYKSVGEDEIFYSVDDQVVVDDVRDSLILNYPVSFEIYDESMADIFSNLLTEKKMEYTMYEQVGGVRFVMNNKYRSGATELLQVARERR